MSLVWWAWRIWAHCKEYTEKWADAADVMLLISDAQDVYADEFWEEEKRREEEEESRSQGSAAGALVAMWLLTAE